MLNKFLAPYVDNLNTDQLNISLFSGEVVLKGLKLKKEALDKFRLPVDVIEGESINLYHPLSNLVGILLLLELTYRLARS